MQSRIFAQFRSWVARMFTHRLKKPQAELLVLPAALESYRDRLLKHFAEFQTETGSAPVALHPETASEYSLRGEAYLRFIYQTGNDSAAHSALYELALADINQALKRHPDSGYCYYQRARVYQNGFHKHDQAIADFTRAIDLGCRIPEAYFNRGLLYHWRGEQEKARADFAHVQGIPGFRDYTPAEYRT